MSNNKNIIIMNSKIIGGKILLFCFCILLGCSGNKTNRKINNDYVGQWEMKIKDMPKVGDVSFEMNIMQYDSVYYGYFVELNGDTVLFKKVELDDDCLHTRYDWGGHDVGFKVELQENNKNMLKGSFMRFFDVEGTRKY